MNAKPVVYLGPSLCTEKAADILDADYRPPVRCGDVYRAVKNGAAVIGIVDGVFEAERAVWHKEILWALSEGVVVYGAASMGALRAVELVQFGMRGVGKIFNWYMDGLVEDDEEVAVLHAPNELSYENLTEASVNVRATLASAVSKNVISQANSEKILKSAKTVYFKHRTRRRILSDIHHLFEANQIRDETLVNGHPEPLLAWLDANWIDQKSLDARGMLATIRDGFQSKEESAPSFEFQETLYWRMFVNQYS